MYILPAIDLRDGKCVRLIQGQYHRQITYEANPVKKAREFISAGAKWLHIVDLEGARLGRPVNLEAIEAIAGLKKLKIELGGGIRQEESIRQMLDMGLERVIIGTKAISDLDWLGQTSAELPGRIALGLDSRGSKVATHGWTQDSPKNLIDFAREADKLALAAIIYTDINKDGMLAGPNFDRTRAVVEAVETPVIAAGGVTEISDIKKLSSFGVSGVIIGRALYEGSITLEDAIATAGQ